jgi:hypothetical protein
MPIVLTLIRRFRGPLVAVVALVFSASVAMAGQPASPGAAGLAKAAAHTSQTTTVTTGDEQGEQDETTETDESTDTSDSADNCTTDPNTVDVSTLTHGQVVCWAAHQDTPEGFANHGAWVKSWATQNHGSDAAATGKGHKPANLPSH